MSIESKRKKEVISEYALKDGDTGYHAIQIAILTESISNINDH